MSLPLKHVLVDSTEAVRHLSIRDGHSLTYDVPHVLKPWGNVPTDDYEELDILTMAIAPPAHEYPEEKSDDYTMRYCLALKIQTRRQATNRAEFRFISSFKSPCADDELFKILFYTPASPSVSLLIIPEVQHHQIPNEDSKEIATSCSPKIFCNDKVAPHLKTFVRSPPQAPHSASSVLVGFSQLLISSKLPFSFPLRPMLSTDQTSISLITLPQEVPATATRRSSGKDPPSTQNHSSLTHTSICPMVPAPQQWPSNTSTHGHSFRRGPGVSPQYSPPPSRPSKIETVYTETQDTKNPVSQQRPSGQIVMQATLCLLAWQTSPKLVSLLSRALAGVIKLIISPNLIFQALHCRIPYLLHEPSLLNVSLQNSPSMTTRLVCTPGRQDQSKYQILVDNVTSVAIAASIQISDDLFKNLLPPKLGRCRRLQANLDTFYWFSYCFGSVTVLTPLFTIFKPP